MLPSYDDVVGSCNQLSLDFDTAFLNSTDALAALNQKFRGVTGSSQMDYAGWDGALITYARALLSQKKDIQSVLDPSGAAPIIDQISQAANTIQGRLTVDLDLAKDPNMSGNLLQTALHWALSGQMASQDFLTQVLDTVNNTVAIFPSSTSSMIQALAQNPTGADNAATLAFARSISTEYKNTAASLVTAIAGLDEDNFVQSKIDSAIQQKYTLDQFKLWLTEANAAQSFAARDRARKTQDDVFFDSNLKSVIDRGLNEGWTETAYQGLEAIAPVSNYSEFCGNNKGSDSSLANCGSDFEYYSESSGKFLDPVFGGRYARASQNFQGFFQTLSDSSYFSDRSTLMDAFFQPLWSHCANSEFVNRLGSLTSLVNSLVGADPLQKFKIEDQIREVLSDCTPTSQ